MRAGVVVVGGGGGVSERLGVGDTRTQRSLWQYWDEAVGLDNRCLIICNVHV